MNGIRFGNKHTADDWDLILKKRPTIEAPSIKENYISVTGRNGDLDLSEALTGKPTYNNRAITCEFDTLAKYEEWDSLLEDIFNYLHGQRKRITLDTDPNWYYEGRCSVDFDNDRRVGNLTIACNCDPFKYKQTVSSNIKTLSGIATDFTCNVEGLPVVPTFTLPAETTIVFNGNSYVVTTSGKYKNYDIEFTEGENIININTTGEVKIEWQEVSF